jgi:hypothetical protein
MSYVLCKRRRQTVIRLIHSLESDTLSILITSQSKPLLTVIRWDNSLRLSMIYRRTRRKPVLHAENEFELLKTLYISIEMTFHHEWYCVQLGKMMQLIKSQITDLMLYWQFIIDTLRSLCCQTLIIKSSSECWLRLSFLTWKTISERKMHECFINIMLTADS